MKVLSRLKTNASSVVDVEKLFDGDIPQPKELNALYSKNVGNIVKFNDGPYGTCYVKSYQNERNYTFIYKDDKNYLITKLINGKETAIILSPKDIQTLQKI